MLYVDSSAFAKRYLTSETDHAHCLDRMGEYPLWGTSRLTWLETLRPLRRISVANVRTSIIEEFEGDLAACALVDVDRVTLAMARDVAATTNAKSLDAIHIASALRIADGALRFLTYDQQQAQAAMAMGLTLAT